ILTFLRDLDTPEIHGYNPDFGYRVYTEKAIEMCRPVLTPGAAAAGLAPAEAPAAPAAAKPKKSAAKSS
ncbi:hypothetical protein, partial [Mycolicibacterium sp. CBMA 361]